MKRVLLSMVRDESGQDLVEYALMAGFVALAAGAVMPGVAVSIQTILSKLLALDILTVRISCGVLAFLSIGILVFRRKKSVDE